MCKTVKLKKFSTTERPCPDEWRMKGTAAEQKQTGVGARRRRMLSNLNERSYTEKFNLQCLNIVIKARRGEVFGIVDD